MLSHEEIFGDYDENALMGKHTLENGLTFLIMNAFTETETETGALYNPISILALPQNLITILRLNHPFHPLLD